MDIGRDERSVKSLSRHTLEQIVTRSSEGVLLVDAQDPNLPIVYANPAYEDLSGYSADELAGSAWPLVKRNVDGQPELERLKAAMGSCEPCRVTLTDLRKDGTPWFSHVSVEPLYTARGALKYFLCLQKPAAATSADQGNGAPSDSTKQQPNVEITLLRRELGRARQKIENLNRIDPSTGLMRLGYFQETLQRDLAIARRDQRFVTVLLFEIVEFDVYRQTFGARAADSCQRMIGAQISRTLRRASDLCSRYNDSTLIAAVLGQAPDEVRWLVDQIAQNVERLRLHNPRARSGRYITIHSVVVGCPPATQEDAETLIARAETALRGERDNGSGARAAQR